MHDAAASTKPVADARAAAPVVAPVRAAAAEDSDRALRALFDRARAGDRAALNTLCRQVRPRLYRTAFAVLRDADEADDVAQDALVRAMTRTFLFLGRGSLIGWLAKIALNLAKNRVRDVRRRREIVEGAQPGERAARGAEAQPMADGLAVASTHQTRARVLAAIDTLSDRQRDVVRLQLIGELETSDVARALSMTEANVRVTLSQARKKLMALLNDAYESGGPHAP